MLCFFTPLYVSSHQFNICIDWGSTPRLRCEFNRRIDGQRPQPASALYAASCARWKSQKYQGGRVRRRTHRNPAAMNDAMVAFSEMSGNCTVNLSRSSSSSPTRLILMPGSSPLVVTEVAAVCLVDAPSLRSALDDPFLDVETKPQRDVLLAVFERLEDCTLRFGRVLLLRRQPAVGHIPKKKRHPPRRYGELPSPRRARRGERPPRLSRRARLWAHDGMQDERILRRDFGRQENFRASARQIRGDGRRNPFVKSATSVLQTVIPIISGSTTKTN